MQNPGAVGGGVLRPRLLTEASMQLILIFKIILFFQIYTHGHRFVSVGIFFRGSTLIPQSADARFLVEKGIVFA